MARWREEDKRAHARVALLCAVFANSMGAKRRGRAYQPKDFMPAEERIQPDHIVRQKAIAFAAAFGAEIPEHVRSTT